jgi:biopolymer transport protein ExbD
MNRIRVVCLIAGILIARGAKTATQTAPPLQAGISVQMPVTKNATPMPEADRADALIVTLTGTGKVYLGIQPSNLNLLQADLQRAAASREMSKTLYIKPDAHVPYAIVMAVVDAAAAAGIERSVLLTSQPDSPQLQTPAPPRGFAIMTRGSRPERSRACF